VGPEKIRMIGYTFAILPNTDGLIHFL